MDGFVSVLKWVLLCTGCTALAVHAQTRPLNDTGQMNCYNSSNNVTTGSTTVATACNSSTTGSLPHQDGRYGRDVANPSKVGGGAAGFDFSCVLWNGTVINGSNCQAGLTANTTGTATGTPATDWACTKDNVTGLVWSLQSQGTVTWTTAIGTTYPDAGHNSASRCGFATGWRLPTRRELLSIVHNGRTGTPMVDPNLFPSTQASDYWSSNTTNVPAEAWGVTFANGSSSGRDKTIPSYVRLVRGP